MKVTRTVSYVVLHSIFSRLCKFLTTIDKHGKVGKTNEIPKTIDTVNVSPFL